MASMRTLLRWSADSSEWTAIGILAGAVFVLGTNLAAADTAPVRVAVLVATPDGILAGKKVPVTFRAYVAGNGPQPASLKLHQAEPGGKLKSPPIAELRDDKTKGDAYAGDRIYTATVELGPFAEGIVRYGLSATGPELPIVAPTYGLHVAPFPLVIPSSEESYLLPDPHSKEGYRLFWNEVVVRFRPGVDRKRVEEIVGKAGGKVVGHSPQLRLYLIRIAGDKTAAGVQTAIDTYLQYKKGDVEYAVPNHESFPLQPSPVAAASPQWHWSSIDPQSKRPPPPNAPVPMIKVAIVDTMGEVDFAHPDLAGQGLQVTGNPAGFRTHATLVAGLIGASGQGGFTGLAAGRSVLLGYFAFGEVQIANAISRAVEDGAQIINLSLGCGARSDPGPVETALQAAVAANRLVVVAAGNPATCTAVEAYPAKLVQVPALAPAVLTVGGVDKGGALARWTERGTGRCSNSAAWINLYAPGQEISSTSSPGNGFASSSGTSFAAALASGAAAVLWEMHPELNAAGVRKHLIDSARQCAPNSGSKCLDLSQALN